MNERIKELWDKAAQAAAAYPSGQNNSWETQVNFMDKFAELIVQECAQVSEDDITDGDACCTNTADRIARQIKKHFGVEE